MPHVHRILRRKGSEILTTTPETSVYDAIVEMEAHNVGSLVVIDEEAIAGIITERDYLRKVILKDRSSRTTQVREIMSTPVVTVSTEDTVSHCMSLMNQYRCRHLPVEDAGKLVGLVSIGDLVNQMLRDQKREIGYLSGYLEGPQYRHAEA